MMLNVGGRMIPLSQAATMTKGGLSLPGTGGPVVAAPLGRPSEHALASQNSARRQGKARRLSGSSAAPEPAPATPGAAALSAAVPSRRTSAASASAAAPAAAAALAGGPADSAVSGSAEAPSGVFLDWLEASSGGRFYRTALADAGFVYLRVGRHLYDLELSTGLECGAVRPRPAATPSAMAADAAAERAARFVILSAQGLTCHIEGDVSFISAERFEVEWARYRELMARPFFRRFRAWRVFELWKVGGGVGGAWHVCPSTHSRPPPPPGRSPLQRGLRQRRLAARRAELERSLFLTDVTLRPALLEVRRYCLQVASLKLFAVEAATFSLRDWLEQQESARHAVAAAFGEMFGEVRRLVLYAAAVSLGRYMRELGLDAGGHALLPVLTASAAPPPIAAAATAAAQLGAPKYHTMFAMPRDLRYTTRAAARTQCRRLLRFVRLADVSLWTALQVRLPGIAPSGLR